MDNKKDFERMEKMLELAKEMAKDRGVDFTNDPEFKEVLSKFEFLKCLNKKHYELKAEDKKLRKYKVFQNHNEYNIEAHELEFSEDKGYVEFIRDGMYIAAFYQVSCWIDITD